MKHPFLDPFDLPISSGYTDTKYPQRIIRYDRSTTVESINLVTYGSPKSYRQIGVLHHNPQRT